MKTFLNNCPVLTIHLQLDPAPIEDNGKIPIDFMHTGSGPQVAGIT